MKNIIKYSIALIALLGMISCGSDNKPNYQYMPNMYEPVGYETYGEYGVFENGMEAMLPVEGTVARGWQPYDYKNTTDELNRAKDDLKNPLPITEENLAAGSQLYTIYCAVCHGDKGDGNGILMQREKILGIPSYAAEGRNITEGGVYHVQMYGLNTMGSYASQTNEMERWQITHHVMNLKAVLEGRPISTPVQTEDGNTQQLVSPSDTSAVDNELEAEINSNLEN
ncbi:cytochrome c [Patiriisocius marinistellae]|uniref:Cytochrome c n=1 Tax=Patiriisocius marinistellae TaxID=2494560 RepID=A0A5J4FTZ8_9FLAO|nr:cytochrome c [Patiriisocius marinistellae]GEQ85260.1 cytochrome c [Patiriisocius marinistellae]